MQVALEAAGVVAWEFDVITLRLEYVGKMSALANAELEQAFRNELLEHAKGGAGTYCKDFRLVQPDGSVIWIRSVPRPLV